jgi:hypothetical protein
VLPPFVQRFSRSGAPIQTLPSGVAWTNPGTEFERDPGQWIVLDPARHKLFEPVSRREQEGSGVVFYQSVDRYTIGKRVPFRSAGSPSP